MFRICCFYLVLGCGLSKHPLLLPAELPWCSRWYSPQDAAWTPHPGTSKSLLSFGGLWGSCSIGQASPGGSLASVLPPRCVLGKCVHMWPYLSGCPCLCACMCLWYKFKETVGRLLCVTTPCSVPGYLCWDQAAQSICAPVLVFTAPASTFGCCSLRFILGSQSGPWLHSALMVASVMLVRPVAGSPLWPFLRKAKCAP